MKRILMGLGIVLSFGLAMMVGDFIDLDERLRVENRLRSTEIHSGGYSYINPLLECNIGADTFKVSGLDPIRVKLQKFIDAEAEKGNIANASVYFRDLNNGPWFGIGEHRKFAPASLLKLPILFTYFKKSEENKNILSEKIEFKQDIEVPEENFSPLSSLELGKTYTVLQLLEFMMQDSDNKATILLLDKMNDMSVKKTMHEIGVELDTSDPNQDVITVQGYATLYRILYNASFLSKENSSKVLSMLTKSHFKDGIVAGVPKTVKVANKYGERQLAESNQLHDCGIVYYKNNPYSLCIMTRGHNYADMLKFISSASKIVYDGVSEKYK